MRRRKEGPGERLKERPHRWRTRIRSCWKSALGFATPVMQPGRVSSIALDFRDPPAESIRLLLPPQILEIEKAAGPGPSDGAARIRAGYGATIAGAGNPIRSIALTPATELGTDAFAPLPIPTVRRCMTLGMPEVKRRPLMAASSTVRAAGLLAPSHAAPPGKRQVGLLAGPAVLDRSFRFGRIPHSRCGIDLESLGNRERLDYLREAEILRGVPPERGELLAVFQKVPVELIVRIRFFADSGMLLYTIARTAGLQRTRLHDLAAVRNKDSGSVHLIAHRTRYRTAFLA